MQNFLAPYNASSLSHPDMFNARSDLVQVVIDDDSEGSDAGETGADTLQSERRNAPRHSQTREDVEGPEKEAHVRYQTVAECLEKERALEERFAKLEKDAIVFSAEISSKITSHNVRQHIIQLTSNFFAELRRIPSGFTSEQATSDIPQAAPTDTAQTSLSSSSDPVDKRKDIDQKQATSDIPQTAPTDTAQTSLSSSSNPVGKRKDIDQKQAVTETGPTSGSSPTIPAGKKAAEEQDADHKQATTDIDSALRIAKIAAKVKVDEDKAAVDKEHQELEIIKAKHMYDMVEDIRVEERECKLVIFSNVQAKHIAETADGLAKLLAACGIDKPSLVINLLASGGFREHLMKWYPEGSSNGLGGSDGNFAGLVPGMPAFESEKAERKAIERIDLFMAEVVIPMARQARAVVLTRGMAGDSILSESFTRVYQDMRPQCNQKDDFTVISVADELYALYAHKDYEATFSFKAGKKMQIKCDEEGVIKGWTSKKGETGPAEYKGMQIGDTIVGFKLDPDNEHSAWKKPYSKELHEEAEKGNKPYDVSVILGRSKDLHWTHVRKASTIWKKREPSLEVAGQKILQGKKRMWDLDAHASFYLLCDNVDLGSSDDKHKINTQPFSLLMTALNNHLSEKHPALAMITGFTERRTLEDVQVSKSLAYPLSLSRTQGHVVLIDIRDRKVEHAIRKSISAPVYAKEVNELSIANQVKEANELSIKNQVKEAQEQQATYRSKLLKLGLAECFDVCTLAHFKGILSGNYLREDEENLLEGEDREGSQKNGRKKKKTITPLWKKIEEAETKESNIQDISLQRELVHMLAPWFANQLFEDSYAVLPQFSKDKHEERLRKENDEILERVRLQVLNNQERIQQLNGKLGIECDKDGFVQEVVFEYQEATYTFESGGKMGIEYDKENGYVQKVEEGGEAEKKGIKTDSRIVNFTPKGADPIVYSKDTKADLDRAQEGSSSYAVTLVHKEKSQAHRRQIEKGHQIVKVDTFPYSKKVLSRAEKSTCDYEVTVRKYQQQATYTFNGQMGVVCGEDGIVLQVRENGPADTNGINRGDEIRNVGTNPFSEEGLKAAEGSECDYTVTVVRKQGKIESELKWNIGDVCFAKVGLGYDASTNDFEIVKGSKGVVKGPSVSVGGTENWLDTRMRVHVHFNNGVCRDTLVEEIEKLEGLELKAYQLLFRERIFAMETWARNILLSPKISGINLFDLKKSEKSVKSLILKDRLPEENSLEGLLLLQQAWRNYDVAEYLATWYKNFSKCIFSVQLIVGLTIICFSSLAPTRSNVIFALTVLGGGLVPIEPIFHANARWLTLRTSAGELKSAIWCYRTRVGDFEISPLSGDRVAELAFRDYLTNWTERLSESANLDRSTLAKTYDKKHYKHQQDREDPMPNDTDNKSSGFKRHLTRSLSVMPEHDKRTKPNVLDDHYSPTKPEDYINLRILPSMDFYQTRIPQYGRILVGVKILLLFCAITTACLSRYHIISWVTIVTGFASVTTTWSENIDAEKKLMRHSRVVRELTNIHTWWKNLISIEKASPELIKRLVTASEEAISQERIAWSAVKSSAKGDKEEKKE